MKSGIAKVTVNCYGCGSPQWDFVASGCEHEYDNTTDDLFTVVKCSRCQLHYLNPRPDLTELPTIYPADYYAYHLEKKNEGLEARKTWLYKARRHVYLSRLEKAISPINKGEELKVLDVGCADGRALNWYKQLRTVRVKTFGVDFDSQAVQLARANGHEVYEGRFEETDLPLNYFDLVVATHVIEHVAEPEQFAAKAFQVLRPGGMFLVETPNIDSVDAKLFKNGIWGGYHFPRHWVFYNKESLSSMLSKTGFTISQVSYHPAPAFWNWTFHALLLKASRGQKGPIKKMADFIFPPTDFQQHSLKNLFAVCVFTGLDIVLKLLSGKTSNMSILAMKPELSSHSGPV